LNDPGLSLRIVWQDPDMVEVRIAAASETTVTGTKLYTQYSELSHVASVLDGFPASPSDTRTFTLGSRDSDFFECTLSCYDKFGHAIMSVEVASMLIRSTVHAFAERSFLEMEFEPEAMVGFRSQLLRMVERKDGEAVLRGVQGTI